MPTTTTTSTSTAKPASVSATAIEAAGGGQTPGSPGYGVVPSTVTVADVTSPGATYKETGAPSMILPPVIVSNGTIGNGGPLSNPGAQLGNISKSLGEGSSITAMPSAAAQTAQTTATQHILSNNAAGTPIKIPSNTEAEQLAAEYGINQKLLNAQGYTLAEVANTPVLTKEGIVYTFNGIPVGSTLALAGGGLVLESLGARNAQNLSPVFVEEISAANVRNQG